MNFARGMKDVPGANTAATAAIAARTARIAVNCTLEINNQFTGKVFS